MAVLEIRGSSVTYKEYLDDGYKLCVSESSRRRIPLSENPNNWRRYNHYTLPYTSILYQAVCGETDIDVLLLNNDDTHTTFHSKGSLDSYGVSYFLNP